MDLDTPGDDGVSKRAKLEKLKRDTFGQNVHADLLSEVLPNPEDDILFDIFFEIYSADAQFYTALDAYCRVWEMSLSGEEISLLSVLWKEADKFNSARLREKHKKATKGKGQSSTSQPSRRPSRGGSRR